jgi:hypothetical protein
MIAALLRLFAIRPFLTMAIFGIPVLLLIAVGLFTIWTLKIVILVVLPLALIAWLVRSLLGPPKAEP